MPPPPPQETVYLNERIVVTINVFAYLFQHFWKEIVLLQEFDERRAAAFEITTIRSFKHDPLFLAGAEGVDPIDLLLLFVQWLLVYTP